MPRNKGNGGKKSKKQKTGTGIARELILRDTDNGTEQAQVTRILGNGVMEGQCFDGRKRKCIIRGCMGRRKWVNINDVVLVSLREFEDDKCDITHKFQPDEVRKLKEKGELPDSVMVNENTDTNDENDINFVDDEGNDVELVQNSKYEIDDDEDDDVEYEKVDIDKI